MVALQLGSFAQGCHGYPTRSAIVLPYLSRHLPQAHLLLMSLNATSRNSNHASIGLYFVLIPDMYLGYVHVHDTVM